MSAIEVDSGIQVLATSVVTMPRLSGSRETARCLAAGGPIDAALIDCSAMEASSLSVAQELIHQLVDLRGARWVQLIEPTAFWSGRVRSQMEQRGMPDTLSIVPRTFPERWSLAAS
ncbi:hypothetical protein [Brachybacterium sacelli]|uniref:STAS domain-containing protein n=2 Tax=Brachybacterium sacelli TaxID=173364 RepID=A0ABS4X695_9MICO|nr:hypothetical protein [Brachybacterium sacelli]MBP2383768.1 hypothetical protein [Brachybacterium sacelli]